jgi:hypothetical protein
MRRVLKPYQIPLTRRSSAAPKSPAANSATGRRRAHRAAVVQPIGAPGGLALPLLHQVKTRRAKHRPS